MSQQPVHIPALLSQSELNSIDLLVAKSNFIDGKLMANRAARDVKDNWQIDVHDEHLAEIQKISRWFDSKVRCLI